MNDAVGWAFTAIIVALIAWQVVTGEILTRGVPSIRITREEQPTGFWLAIVLQSAIAVTIFGIFVYRIYKEQHVTFQAKRVVILRASTKMPEGPQRKIL